ncbi:LysM domain-containing protein [Mesorhizobium sp. M0323]|uniref:LysM peptidoglycan-binding domain-containing protein n=1 Tax=Mesorhizobium sp. M0323 TaxID=2956938 RepID=UPI00333A56D5
MTHWGNFLARIAVILLGVVSPTVITAAPPSTYEDRSVESPLDTKEALIAFIEAFGEPPAGFTENAHNMLYYGYHIEPMTTCPSDYVCADFPPSSFLIFRRTVRYSLTGVTEHLAAAVRRLEQDGCSKLRIDRPTLEVAAGRVLQYGTKAHFKRRKCAFGNSITYASGSARITSRVLLNLVRPSYQQDGFLGDLALGKPDVQVSDTRSKLFELIEIGTLKGYLISGFLDGLRLSAVNTVVAKEVARVIEQIKSIDTSEVLAFFSSGLRSFQEFIEIVSDVVGKRPNYWDVDRTGFGCAKGVCYVTISQEQFIPVSSADAVYAQKVCEVETLRSFKKPQETVKVRKGDTLWAIAKEKLCSGELYQYLVYVNNYLEKPRSLKIGMEITVPPLYKFYTLKENIIKTGDSIWSRYVRFGKGVSWSTYWKTFPIGSSGPGEVYPLQFHEVTCASCRR